MEIDVIEGNKIIARFMGYEYFASNDERLIQDKHRHEPGWKTHPYASMIPKFNTGFPSIVWPEKGIHTEGIEGFPRGREAYLCRSHNQLAYHVSITWLMKVVKEMNQKPWWVEYNSDSLAIALVSADIQGAWEIVVKAILKYENV